MNRQGKPKSGFQNQLKEKSTTTQYEQEDAWEICPISDRTQQAEKAQKSTRWDQRSLLLQTLFGGGRILIPCYS